MEKEIEVLQGQIEKLKAKKFDLDAWKTSTKILLSRIFGPNNHKVRMIEDLRFDYGSWSLRDATGKDHDSAGRKHAAEILEAAILELETLGAPSDHSGRRNKDGAAGQSIELESVLSAIEDEMTVSQFKSIREILKTAENDDAAREQLITQLQKFGSLTSFNIVANLLSNATVKREVTR